VLSRSVKIIICFFCIIKINVNINNKKTVINEIYLNNIVRKIFMFRFIKYKKLVFFLLFTFAFLIFIETGNTQVRSKKEVKIGIFLEDYEKFGKFKKINDTPQGMFPESEDTFFKKQKISKEKFIETFITRKGQMDKYTQNVVLGMGYFEFFYMQQLKEKKRSLATFKKKYPKINAATKKNIIQIYGLNKARKTMRDALGLTLDNTPEEAIARYYTLYKLLNQANLIEIKLSKEEIKQIKKHKVIAKNIFNLVSLVTDKIDQRLTDKKFENEYKKNFKILNQNFREINEFIDYQLLSSFILQINKFKTNNNYSQLLSGLKISNYILDNIKKERIPKRYEQDLSNANFDVFTRDELTILGDITKSTKENKNKKSNDIQIHILNLENNGFPVNNFLNFYREELNVKLQDINLQLASATRMESWKVNDWANAWKNPIPKSYVDDAGIEITFSNDDIEAIKAQLAIKNFKEILDLETFSSLIINDTDKFSNIANDIDLDVKNFEFEFTLDDFAKSFGDTYGLDINNYADLTDLANATYNEDWSVEEYASAYQGNIDLINALQSGSISSFQAGEIAAAANNSLQQVADTIVAASSAGVSVDLDATFKGMGYDSFADAVAAYNAQHGTNYTTETAREALGQ
tara:strand:+ start:1022 stop:2926 length:1905 start_codon:yes stop_codon:yes gene_type:complete